MVDNIFFSIELCGLSCFVINIFWKEWFTHSQCSVRKTITCCAHLRNVRGKTKVCEENLTNYGNFLSVCQDGTHTTSQLDDASKTYVHRWGPVMGHGSACLEPPRGIRPLQNWSIQLIRKSVTAPMCPSAGLAWGHNESSTYTFLLFRTTLRARRLMPGNWTIQFGFDVINEFVMKVQRMNGWGKLGRNLSYFVIEKSAILIVCA